MDHKEIIAHNNVYMKRFKLGSTGKAIVTPEDKITAYEIWLNDSHASHTLNRWVQ